MTLHEVIQAIEGVALLQPNVRTIVRQDIFRLNGRPDVKYSAFGWLQREHSGDADSDLTNYGFTFFYVDRLAADMENEVAVQSEGMTVLGNVLRLLADYGVMPTTWTMRAFTQRFSDLCAGVYCNVTFEVQEDWTCPVEFPDFDADFNGDFLIIKSGVNL